MKLEERIKETEILHKKAQKNLHRLSDELYILTHSKQPSNQELFNGIEQYFATSKSTGEYEFILGGDDRSSPWSESRKGTIVKIFIRKGIYLDDDQRKTVLGYVKETRNGDHYEFIN